MVSPPPRFRSLPERKKSLGLRAVRFATRAGIKLDAHQRQVLTGFMGQTAKGAWSSFENALIEPRQNGKTEILLTRVLFGAFELGERHIVYSAHMWATAHEAFLRACDIVESNRQLAARVAKTRRSAADLGFVLDSGERIRFVTRSRATARGFAGDVVVFDEAHFLAEATHAALLPALSARSKAGKVQVFYACSAADQTRHPDAVVVARIRERGIQGDDPSLAYFEWSAPVLDVDGNEVPPDRVPDDVAADVKVQRAANPAFGVRISAEHVASELRALDRRSFATERLGVGDWPATDSEATGPIHLEDWDALADPSSAPLAPVCIGFDVSPDRRVAVAIAGRRDDGLFHVEITDSEQGTGRLVERLVQLIGDHDPWLVCADPFGLTAVLCDRIEEQAGREVHHRRRARPGVRSSARARRRGDVAASRLRRAQRRDHGGRDAHARRRLGVVAAELCGRHLSSRRRVAGVVGGRRDAGGDGRDHDLVARLVVESTAAQPRLREGAFGRLLCARG
jgi:hypothetical protein